ncbi:MAG: dienelactone hydrolase family protein [Chloroflexi bacterium]|nr:dienelactone hydrolase family protein [Chloroflexota bacterium]
MPNYEGLLAETVTFEGDGGDVINAYLARPLGPGPYPGVIVVHHMPGWDEATKEITRRFAHHGYVAVMPNLHYREAPDSTPDDAAAISRSAGGVSDDRFIGDAEGAARYLGRLPYYSGSTGIIGFCSGGRQTYLAAGRMKTINAAVDCWGGRVIAKPEELTEKQPVAPIDYTPNITVPLLGIFGQDDSSPSPEQVNATEVELKKHGVNYVFHRYEGAGHGFFASDRPSYRPVQAKEAWGEVFKFFGANL